MILATTGCGGGSDNAGATRTTSSPSSTPSTRSSGTAGPAIPAPSLNGKILFTKAGGKYGDETVFTADADGSHVRRVTPKGRQCCATWSVDGSHILISASAPDGRVTTGIVNAQGRHEQIVPLTVEGLNLGCAQAQSIRGGRLACEGWSDTDTARAGVHSLSEATGGDVVRLTKTSFGTHDRPIAMSPDGGTIYFFRPILGFPKYGDDLEGSIFSVRSDRTGLKRVTPARLPVEVVGNAGGRLSPDGSWILFTSSGVIWRVRIDGSQLTQVFQSADGSLAITPTWSPDGKLSSSASISQELWGRLIRPRTSWQ